MLGSDNVEYRLLNLLPGLAGRLPDVDLGNARNLIEHREWGVGLETLCTQLDEYEVVLTKEELDALSALAAELKVDISYLGK